MLNKILFAFRMIFPGKPHFTADDIPDLSGKVVIVTGANTGEDQQVVHNDSTYMLRNRHRERESQSMSHLNNLEILIL